MKKKNSSTTHQQPSLLIQQSTTRTYKASEQQLQQFRGEVAIHENKKCSQYNTMPINATTKTKNTHKTDRSHSHCLNSGLSHERGKCPAKGQKFIKCGRIGH